LSLLNFENPLFKNETAFIVELELDCFSVVY